MSASEWLDRPSSRGAGPCHSGPRGPLRAAEVSSPRCRFILLACDGLFKVFTPEEAVHFILSCLEVRRPQGSAARALEAKPLQPRVPRVGSVNPTQGADPSVCPAAQGGAVSGETGVREPLLTSTLSRPTGREDPEPGREARRGRPLRSRLQPAGHQGGAAGLRRQRDGDGGADRALRPGRGCVPWASPGPSVSGAHCVFHALWWAARGCK